MEKQSTLTGWAIIELMGHSREIGYVTTEYFGGPALFRIDQPPLPERDYELTRAQWIGETLAPVGTKVKREAVPGKTVYVGPHAIFRLNPCDEQTALRGVEQLIPAPIKILSLPERPQLTAAPEQCDCADADCPNHMVDGCEAPSAAPSGGSEPYISQCGACAAYHEAQDLVE